MSSTALLSDFQKYIHDVGIQMYSAITPHASPGRGLGIYTTRRVDKGAVLMYVPISAVVMPPEVSDVEVIVPSGKRKKGKVTTSDGVNGGSVDEKEDMEKELVIRAHAKLAAHVAFGNLEEENPAWLATWPSLGDFETSLPLLWPARVRGCLCVDCIEEEGGYGSGGGASFGERKTATRIEQTDAHTMTRTKATSVRRLSGTIRKEENSSVTLNGESLSGKSLNGESLNGESLNGEPLNGEPRTHDIAALPSNFCTHSTSSQFSILPPSTQAVLSIQSAKHALDLAAAQRLYPSLDFTSLTTLSRWKWAWCAVNTRCFYYVAPGSDHPDDADEAMVLCPGIDLCNHSGSGCDVTFDNEGFWVKAERDYDKGEEVVTTYGSHGEDTLLVEYGFLLGRGKGGGEENEWDAVGIEAVVLASLNQVRNSGESGVESCRRALEEHGYLGGYTLKRDGVCWRTEVAARCLVMERGEWEMFVMGKWTDDEDVVARKRKRRKEKNNTGLGKGGAFGRQGSNAKQRANEQIRRWIEEMKKEAEKSLHGLQAMGTAAAKKLFGNEPAKYRENNVDDKEDSAGNRNGLRLAESNSNDDAMADARYALVVKRWQQIRDMCDEALRGLELSDLK